MLSVIPLGTDRGLARPTVVNHLLILANIIVFGAITVAALRTEQGVAATDGIVDRWMLTRDLSQPWRLVTYAFLHDMTSMWHLLGNMLFLWVFGPNVEDRMGRLGYLAFYLIAAIASGFGHILVSDGPAIGASGAIAGVTGAYMVLFPRTQVRVFFLFFTVGVIHMSALWFISLSVILNILGAVMHRPDQIAYGAHLFGYGYGMVVAFGLLGTGLLKGEPFDLFHMVKQARRRAEIREAYREHVGRAETAFAPKGLPKGVEPAISEMQRPVAEARAEIARLLAASDTAAAADRYRSLLEKYGLVPGAATMSRRQQLDLANHFFQTSDYSSAIAAYERFLEAFPRDGEAAHIRLLLAVIAGRYLHQAPRARSLLGEAMPGLHEADQLAIARDLLAELGPAPASPAGSG